MSTPQIASSKAIYFCFEVYASATLNSAPYRADERGYLLQQDEWNVVLSFICMQDFRTQRHRSIALQAHVCTIGFMFERADWLSLQICGVRPLHPVRGKMTFRRKQEAYRGYVYRPTQTADRSDPQTQRQEVRLRVFQTRFSGGRGCRSSGLSAKQR
jgi:hypothetical protein